MLKLKADVKFELLETFGFVEDEANVEEGDHYYSTNNYYLEVHKEFRIVVNMIDRSVQVFCLPKDFGVCNTDNINVVYDLILAGLIDKVD